VLLVEDNPVNQEVGREMLAALGYCVGLAADGAQALVALAEEPYDAVLMDCHMPVLDGFEATRRFRELEGGAPGTRRLPIIALTANALLGDREACQAAGMDDYLAKPYTAAQIGEVLRRWLPHAPATAGAAGSGSRAGGPAADAPACDPGAGPFLDLQALDQIRALQREGAPSLLGWVIALYLESAPKQIEGLRAALLEADAPRLRETAHALKSASANVGAQALSALCRDLEAMGRQGHLEGAQEKLQLVEDAYRQVQQALREQPEARVA
jgi:CheY-like chemotaxis protein/HPt (histidine-containing phosphotransfer) domain-containing protein